MVGWMVYVSISLSQQGEHLAMTHVTNWLFLATILYIIMALISASLTLVQQSRERNVPQGMDKLDSGAEGNQHGFDDDMDNLDINVDGNQHIIAESIELECLQSGHCLPNSDSNNIAPIIQPDTQSNGQRVNIKIILQQCSLVDVDILPQDDGNHLTVNGGCHNNQRVVHKHRYTSKSITNHQHGTVTRPKQITLLPAGPEMTETSEATVPHVKTEDTVPHLTTEDKHAADNSFETDNLLSHTEQTKVMTALPPGGKAWHQSASLLLYSTVTSPSICLCVIYYTVLFP
jgi:hypothetical protein